MQYVMEVVWTCPDGSAVGRELWLAHDENEMKTMLHAKLPYGYISCLGPLQNPLKEKWFIDVMEKAKTCLEDS